MEQTAHSSLRKLAWIPLLGLTAALSACYVVPIDPRTGQPYPVPAQSQSGVPVSSIPVNSVTTLQARLYPLNGLASKSGILNATATDANNGRGTFSVVFMGETLQGDASRVDNSSIGFGHIYREVLGSAVQSVSGGRRGIANGFGPNGTSVQCEYQMTAKDIGTGACLFSNGAKYQMHFGG